MKEAPGNTMVQPQELPKWMGKIVKTQIRINKRYEKARQEFAEAWANFVGEVWEINATYNTDFQPEHAASEFEGQTIVSYADDDEDDE